MRYLWILIIALVFPLAAYGYGTPEAFAGKVVDELGQAVSGATVWLTAEEWMETYEPVILARTETAPDGTFRFVDFPPEPEDPGSYTVLVYKEEWAFAWKGWMRHGNQNISLVLPKEFPLEGRVTGPDGQPVAGVALRVSFLVRQASFDPFEIGESSTVLEPLAEIAEMMVEPSDAAGSFVIRHLPPGVNVSLKVRDSRFAHTAARPAWRELRAGRPIEIKLEPPATIRGRVLDAEDGTAKPGLEVALYAVRPIVTTDEKGRFEFTNVRSGVHQVYLHELPTEFTAKAVSDITVEPGATVEGVELPVQRGVTITGTVTAQDTGEPIAEAEICCNTTQQPKVGSAWPLMKTGPDGRYSLQAPEGPAELRTMGLPEGWRSAIPHSRVGHHRRFDVSAGQDPIEVDFEVVPACSISGVVLDPQGEAVPGATVLLSSEDFFTRDTLTDEAGQFVFTSLRPGEERALRAYRGEDMTRQDYILKPEDNGPVSLHLQAGVRPTVTGQAIGEDGQPASYALITVRPPMGTPEAGVVAAYSKFWRTAWSHVLADEQGRFVARALWPGMDCQLRVQAGGYAEQDVDVVALMLQEQRDVGVISLPIADMVITGKVVTADGAPVPGIMVDVWRQRGYFSRRFMATTDTQGQFRFEGLPREEVTVAIDQFSKYQVARVPAGPNDTDVVITVIPKEEQILAQYLLEPPLEQKTEAASATLYGLYRVKVVSEEGQAKECLGLDVQAAIARREDAMVGGYPIVSVVDDQGRRLKQARGTAEVNRRRLRLYELPEPDAAALTIKAMCRSLPDAEPIAFESLRLMAPITRGDLLAMLGKLELTDEWIPAGPGAGVADKGEPPYLLARVYALGRGWPYYEVDTAQVVDDGRQLIPKGHTYYRAGSAGLGCVFGVSYYQDSKRLIQLIPMRYGPAWMAGIQSGDLLLGCNGIQAKDEQKMMQYIRERPVGARVTLQIRRGEEELEIPVTLGQWQEDFEREAQQALRILRQWAYQPPEEATLICYELQSAGGHGEIPIPDALSVTFNTHIYETVGQVTIEDVPLPENLRRK